MGVFEGWSKLSEIADDAVPTAALPTALRCAWFYEANPYLDAAEAALGLLDSSSREVVAQAVRERLADKLVAEQQAQNLYDLVAELQVAAWLSQRGMLAEAPGATLDRDDPIDFGLQVGDSVIGVEVKRDVDDSEDRMTLGAHEHDELALLRPIRKRFGKNAHVTVSWPSGKWPAKEEWGKRRKGVLNRVQRTLETITDLPEDHELKLRVPLEPPIGRDDALVLRVFRGFGTNIQWRWGGEGWGVVQRRVTKHACDKARKTTSEFVLVYVTLPGDRGQLDRDRLAWAWPNLIADGEIPALMNGVVLLSVGLEGDGLSWRSTGALRSEAGPLADMVRGHLGVTRTPPIEPESVPAYCVWSDMVTEMDAVDRDRISIEHRRPWDDLVSRAKTRGPDSPDAEAVWREANILSSSVGVKIIVFERFAQGYASSPFPCNVDALLPPRRPVAPKAN